VKDKTKKPPKMAIPIFVMSNRRVLLFIPYLLPLLHLHILIFRIEKFRVTMDASMNVTGIADHRSLRPFVTNTKTILIRINCFAVTIGAKNKKIPDINNGRFPFITNHFKPSFPLARVGEAFQIARAQLEAFPGFLPFGSPYLI